MAQRMSRASALTLGAAFQAAVLAAACSYDRAKPHPLQSKRVQVAHLLRRAGFGAGEDELGEYLPLSLNQAVDRLLDYESVEDDSEEHSRALGLDLKKLADLQRWWLLRLVHTGRPLQEKMVLFWHGLLVSASGKVGLPNPTDQNPNPPHHMLNQHNFFRAHAVDTFETLVLGISRDPAMLIYLDSQANRKGKPNENYARELMELFTLGIGGPDGAPTFAEQDVREVARAFTGWGIENGRFLFRPANHDAGAKIVLGRTGAFNGDDVVKLLVQQPAAARHLSRRLFEFFAYPDPSEQDLEPLVHAYTTTGGNVKEMLRALFTSPAFYSPRAYRALVKSPVELVVGLLRQLGAATSGATLPGATTRMGQALFNPPNVAGWPGGARWLNTTTWLERVNFCNQVLTGRNDANTIVPDPAGALGRHELRTPADIVDYYAGLLLDGQLPAESRAALLDYLQEGAAPPAAARPAGGRPASAALPGNAVFVDRKVRGLLYLLLASPHYQLA
jgi:uncharacterized protein (DUF1800 family)